MQKKTKKNLELFGDDFFDSIRPKPEPEKPLSPDEPNRIFNQRYLDNLKAIPPEKYSFNSILMKRIFITLADKLSALESKMVGEPHDSIAYSYWTHKPIVIEMAERGRKLESSKK